MRQESNAFGFADYMSLIRRRAWYIGTIIPTFVLGSVFLAYWLTPSYRATITLMLEQPSIPTDIVKSNVQTSYFDDEVNLVRGRVMSTEKLLELVNSDDPYPDMKDATPEEKASRIIEDTQLEKVDPVTLKTTDDSNAFSIYYNNPDPHKARQIARDIADLFVSYNRITRSETAQATHAFLQAQADEINARIHDSDARMAKFKDKYGTAMPDEASHNEIEMDRLQRDLDALEGKIRDDEQHESVLRGNLSGMSPSLLGLTADGRSQLASLKAELADALQRYTPEHPDVRRLRAQIAALTATNAASGAVVPDNPAYVEAQAELAGTVKDLAALRTQAARVQHDLIDYESRLRMAPDVEREYADIARTHEMATKQLADIQNKLSEASISAKIETAERGKHFIVIHPAALPRTPYSPNRVGLILLGTVLGCGLAFGLAALADSVDPTIRSMRDTVDLTSLPTIAAIPTLLNGPDRRKRALGLTAAASIALVAIGAIATTMMAAKHRESDLVAHTQPRH